MEFNQTTTIKVDGKTITNNPITGKITIQEGKEGEEPIVYNWAILNINDNTATIKEGINITTIDLDIEQEVNPARYERIISFRDNKPEPQKKEAKKETTKKTEDTKKQDTKKTENKKKN